MRIYAGFIKAEREKELITIPAFCIADNEMHARAVLTTWAKERWDVRKGWRLHQGYAREVNNEVLFMDERIVPLARLYELLNKS